MRSKCREVETASTVFVLWVAAFYGGEFDNLIVRDEDLYSM